MSLQFIICYSFKQCQHTRVTFEFGIDQGNGRGEEVASAITEMSGQQTNNDNSDKPERMNQKNKRPAESIHDLSETSHRDSVSEASSSSSDISQTAKKQRMDHIDGGDPGTAESRSGSCESRNNFDLHENKQLMPNSSLQDQAGGSAKSQLEIDMDEFLELTNQHMQLDEQTSGDKMEDMSMNDSAFKSPSTTSAEPHNTEKLSQVNEIFPAVKEGEVLALINGASGSDNDEILYANSELLDREAQSAPSGTLAQRESPTENNQGLAQKGMR